MYAKKEKLRKKSESHKPLPEVTANKLHSWQETQKLVTLMQQDPIYCNHFIENACIFWHRLSAPQKAVVVLLTSILLTGSVNYLWHFLLAYEMNTDTVKSFSEPTLPCRFPSNRLSPKEQADINSSIKDKIKINPKPHSDPSEQRQFMREAKMFRKELEPVLANNVVTSRLSKETIEQDGFSIFISKIQAKGMFWTPGNEIHINPEKSNPLELTGIFHNELHHANIMRRNREMGCDKVTLWNSALPWCFNGNWDVTKSKLLREAVNEGTLLLRTFGELLRKVENQEALTVDEQLFYTKALTAMEHFVPIIRTYHFTLESFNQDVLPNLQPSLDEAFPWFCPAAVDPDLDNELNDKMMRYTIDNNHDKVLLEVTLERNTSMNEKRKSLITWIYNYEQGYISHFVEPNNIPLIAYEMASVVDALPVTIKQTFFPSFCEYFSQYFQIEYCDHEEYAAYTTSKP